MVEFILPNDIDESLTKDTGKKIIIDNLTVTERLDNWMADELQLGPDTAIYVYLFRLSINGEKKTIYVKMPIKIDPELNTTHVYPVIYKALVEIIKKGEYDGPNTGK